jgi:hypothetical protein
MSLLFLFILAIKGTFWNVQHNDTKSEPLNHALTPLLINAPKLTGFPSSRLAKYAPFRSRVPITAKKCLKNQAGKPRARFVLDTIAFLSSRYPRCHIPSIKSIHACWVAPPGSALGWRHLTADQILLQLVHLRSAPCWKDLPMDPKQPKLPVVHLAKWTQHPAPWLLDPSYTNSGSTVAAMLDFSTTSLWPWE